MGKILLLSPQQHFQNLYFADFEVQCFFFFLETVCHAYPSLCSLERSHKQTARRVYVVPQLYQALRAQRNYSTVNAHNESL